MVYISHKPLWTDSWRLANTSAQSWAYYYVDNIIILLSSGIIIEHYARYGPLCPYVSRTRFTL